MNQFKITGEFLKTIPDFKETVLAIIRADGEEVALRCWSRDVRAIVSTLKSGDQIEATGLLKARAWEGPKGLKYFPSCEVLTLAKGAAREPGGDDFAGEKDPF